MPQTEHCHQSVTNLLIALGGNAASHVGPPLQTLGQALLALKNHGVNPVTVSRFFTTPSFPAGSGPDYVNAAAICQTILEPGQVLEVLHRVEQQFGRVRDARWGPRTLDLDLLDHGGAVLPDAATYDYWHDLPLAQQQSQTPDQLIVPHPRIQDRAFVLVPLADIAPDWVHPVSMRTVGQMLAQLPEHEKTEIRPV